MLRLTACAPAPLPVTCASWAAAGLRANGDRLGGVGARVVGDRDVKAERESRRGVGVQAQDGRLHAALLVEDGHRDLDERWAGRLRAVPGLHVEERAHTPTIGPRAAPAVWRGCGLVEKC
jgi:hypothetical protein